MLNFLSYKHSLDFFFLISDLESMQNESYLLKPSPDKMNGYYVCPYRGSVMTGNFIVLLTIIPSTSDHSDNSKKKKKISIIVPTILNYFLFNIYTRVVFSANIVINAAWSTFENNLENITGTSYNWLFFKI